MGIRIHKAMGYGLEKFDRDAHPWDFIQERLDSARVQDFYEWAKTNHPEAFSFSGEKMSVDMYLLKKNDSEMTRRLYDNVATNHGIDGDMQSPLVITPFSTANWKRYNNDLDYVEWGLVHGYDDLTDKVHKVDGSLYPYSGYMKIHDNDIEYVSEVARNEEEQKLFGIKYLKSDVKPKIPYSIYLFLKYVGFNEPLELFRDFSPMIFTYWS